MHNLNSLEVQGSHDRTGSAEVKDSITLLPPSTPTRRLGSPGGQSSSPLSEAPTLPSSPAYLKAEDDGDEIEAGRTEATFAAATVQPITRRTRIDVCADRDMVAALQVPDIDPDKPITTEYRRTSQRVRNYALLRSSRTRASTRVSPPVTRRRSKNITKHPMNLKKEETEYKLVSSEISEDVEILYSGAGNGAQQTPLASSPEVMALSNSTLKRKHQGEERNLRDLAIISVSTAAVTENELACDRAKSLPPGWIGGSGAGNTGSGRARRYSGDKDPGGLEPLTKPRGMIENNTGNANDQNEEPSPSTDEDGVFESFTEDEGLPSNADNIVLDESLDSNISGADRSANHEFSGSLKLSDENVLKKQKLNDGQALALPVTKDLGESGEQDVRDPRVHKDAFQLVDGVLFIPRGCKLCLGTRAFCDRAQPCSKCERSKQECLREPGLVPARPKQQRSKQGDPDPRLNAQTLMLTKLRSATLPPPLEISSGGDLEILPSQNTPVTKRGRPRKSDVSGEIESEAKSEVKETKKVKPLLWSSIDFQKGKPPGIRKPEVWCETRQELCESLPYYRSYQAGCYGHDGLVHGGGKSGTDDSGQRRLLTDQTIDDNTIKYLIKNMNQKWPLVLIMGNQCTNSPSKVPHRYCVMDWFKVTAAWAEKDPLSQCIRWKFRFEKLDTNIDGWWAVTPSEEPNPPQDMVKISCLSCEKESPHIYEQGWVCLNPVCKSFWMLDDADMPADLTYTENFLSCRTPWPEDFLQPPNSLAPPLDTKLSAHVECGGVSRPFWKGMCCPQCGRLSCRELWAGWLCPTCKFSYNPPRVVFDAARLADPHRPVYTGPAIPSNLHNEEIASRRFVRDGMTVIQYQLGDCGTVTHILANEVSNSRPEDANWLLENYQNLDMPFRRFPMKCHHSQGRLLTQQFMYNCGAPYKFIVDVNSLPFNDSPPVVLKALRLIHQRVQLIHPEAQFNEVLNVGYFEKQKMDYHDDGEEGLGETVASISLGGSARMKFRVKSKYKDERHCWTTEPEKHCQDVGSGNSIHNDENLEEEEEENSGETAGGLQTSASSMRAKGRTNKAMLDLCLNHGDVMVMKGAGIQTYWEATHNTLGEISKKQITEKTETDENDSTLPLTDAKSVKGEDSAMDSGDIQTTSANGLGGSDHPEVIGGKPNLSQSRVDPHEPESATSPAATVSQEVSSISAVSLPRGDPQGLDTQTLAGASHHPPPTQNMSMSTKPVLPSETTAPRMHAGHHLHGVGPPHTPLSTNQPGSYSGFPLQEFLTSQNASYFSTPQPQITPSHHPSPYGPELAPGGTNSYMARQFLNKHDSLRSPFGGDLPYGYHPHSEAYSTSGGVDSLQSPVSTTSQKSNVHHQVFTSSGWGANESQNPLPSNGTHMQQSNAFNPFQDYNNNGESKNPAANPAGASTTYSTDEGHTQRF
ncbi:hypothetical protein C7212DRAFT_350198 [Tuber magnatum]|uniref:Alpha-ketoglutarate-dependent dioxygenase AlkB-like domain-containing protein n=1 Tax=Tuber magnatum TaxID=42249 RepID=A0A317T0L3_9PEZI|nr:hypothetical protein C7212DRAFT_350198 [Tuber magnatum]